MTFAVSRRLHRAALAAISAACLAVAAPAALAQITLSQDFDSGSLNVPMSSFTPAPGGGTVTLVGRRTWTDPSFASRWRWLHLRAGGVSGLRPTFRITSGNFLGSLSGTRFVYSYDQQNWSFFDNNAPVTGGFYQFSNNTPFAQDDVYVAYTFPYPVSRTAAHTMSVTASSPYVSAAPSTGGDFVVGQSAAGVDDTGRPVAPQDLYAYRVTDAASPHVKKKVILSGGMHSGEPMGNFVLEGMVDAMLGNSPRAALLRRHADAFVYPQVNPAGRIAGYYRSNPENPDKDYNRHWDDPAGFTDMTQLRAAMTSDVGGDADYLIDFHGFFDQGDDFVNLTSNLVGSPFMTALQTYEPAIDPAPSAGDPGMLRIWGSTAAGLRAEFAYTTEVGPRAGRPIERLMQIGASHANALADAIVPQTVKAWQVDSDGDWSAAANWYHGTPSAATHEAFFGPHLTAPRAVTVSAPHTVGTMTFDGPHAYSITGGATLTLAGAVDVVRGSHTIATPLNLPNDATIRVRRAADVLAVTGSMSAQGATLTKSGPGTAEFLHLRAGALNVDGGAVRVRPGGTSDGVSRSSSLNLAGGASPTVKLDLTDNAMILDYAIASPLALVAAQITHARAGGDWTGDGLTSSLADTSTFSLGLAEAGAVFTAFPATFAGQSVDDTTLLLAFTRYGDADLSGTVNLSDFNALAANFGQASRFWWQGDFNYDGGVNLSDFNLLAANFGLSAGADGRVGPEDWSALASAVPEPVALWSAFAVVILSPRRRRGS